MKKENIHEFFVVTMDSVFYVTDQKDGVATPVIETVFSRKEKERRKYIGDDLVGIARRGIVLYDREYSLFLGFQRRERPQPLEKADKPNWRLCISSIVGLFLRKEDAIKCFDSDDREICSPRWKKETLKVIEAIGDSHPIFVISDTEPITY